MKLLLLIVALTVVLGARDVRLRSATLDLEDYVARVLAGEVATFTSAEALKAMAVAARTFAVHHLGRHRAEGFDFCDTTHCQKVGKAALPDQAAAVIATEHELLWYEGKAAATHYHAHCGGKTAAASEIWPGLRAPYLRSAPDTFCLTRGRAEWSRELTTSELPRVTRRTASGRVAEILFGGRRMSAEAFEQHAGALRSNAYGVQRTASGVRFSGFGHGHGVGLCQIGAEERSKAGHTYNAILAFYYPGTTLGIAASGLRWTYAAGERVDAFAVDAASSKDLAAAADRALTEAESISGFSASKRPQVRAYPTLPIYRDATGSGGDIAATTSGFVVRTQPLGLLRSRNALRSTLLHEMLHVLIDSRAHPHLPDWYGEGLALYLSASKPRTGTSHALAAARVRALADRHGRAALLGWVTSGLPAGVQARQTSAAPAR